MMTSGWVNVYITAVPYVCILNIDKLRHLFSCQIRMSISLDVAMISSLPFTLVFQRLLGGVIRALPGTKVQ